MIGSAGRAPPVRPRYRARFLRGLRFCRTQISAHYLEVVYRGEVKECLDFGETIADDPGEARVRKVVVDLREETRAAVEITMKACFSNQVQKMDAPGCAS